MRRGVGLTPRRIALPFATRSHVWFRCLACKGQVSLRSRRFREAASMAPWCWKGRDGICEIVGIVGDAKYITLQEEVQPTLFLNWFQQSDLFLQHSVGSSVFTIRGRSWRQPAVDA